MTNVSCEYDWLNSWNSTLQAAWYIRHIRWTCLFYISFNIEKRQLWVRPIHVWQSSLQAAWYVRHAHWARLCYVPFVIWCLWITCTIWLLIFSSTSFMVGRSRVFYTWYVFLMKDIGRWLPWVLPGSTGQCYKDERDVVHNDLRTDTMNPHRGRGRICIILLHVENNRQNWAKTAIHIIRCYIIQGASLRGRHTPPATLAQEGKIVWSGQTSTILPEPVHHTPGKQPRRHTHEYYTTYQVCAMNKYTPGCLVNTVLLSLGWRIGTDTGRAGLVLVGCRWVAASSGVEHVVELTAKKQLFLVTSVTPIVRV